MTSDTLQFLDRGDGVKLAFCGLNGASPTFVWLSGFKSDMAGTKAQALAQWAKQRTQAFLRFDYSGHGRSDGAFEDGVISRWVEDAVTIIAARSTGPRGLVGSSMGAWIALLLLRSHLGPRIAGLLLVAPAADFTETLLWARLPEDARAAIIQEGRWLRPSAYGDGAYPITRALIEDGRNHLALQSPIVFGGVVRVLQGMRDPDVPWSHAMALVEALACDDVTITVSKNGDHRLSKPDDLARLCALADELAERCG